ncbi:MAG TPA: HlyD family efflux transporter periplasmic adaptor subunit, partial [Longimicrobium sp.]
QKRQRISDGRGALASNSIQVASFRGSLLDLQRERRDRELQVRLTLVSASDALRSALRAWEEKYVLKAPVGGHVSFIRPLSEGQFVAASEPVLAIVPQGPPTTATVMLANSGAGRVRTGQRVVLRLDAYPASEFGTLEGQVRQVSLVADRERMDGDREPRYMVGVDFPRGLMTTQGRRLAPRQELQGTAEVVTDELRVIDRLLYQFRSLRARKSPPARQRQTR